jgi:protein tyrosine phosphatase
MHLVQLWSRAVRMIAATSLMLVLGCAAVPAQNSIPICTNPLDSRIRNSCIVTSQSLWRGAKPDAAAAAALVEKGVKTVVNLEWLHDDRQAFEDAKLSDSSRHEVQYFRVVDWEPLVVLDRPTVDDHVAHFIAITRTQPKPIFVHCRSGQNRTGVMVAAYRVFDGTSIEDANAEMQSYGGIWFASDADYIRSLTPQRISELEEAIARWTLKLKRDAEIVCADTKCNAVPN